MDKVLKPMGPINEAAIDLTVADLLTSDLKWNKQRIDELLPDLATQIQCIKPSTTGAEDSFIWHPTMSGIYTTKSGYFAACDFLQQTEHTRLEGDFSWIRDVWAGKFSPKMKTFLWSILRKAIPLGANLQKRGVVSAIACVRCNEIETEVHYFFTCPYARQVWEVVPINKAVHLAASDKFEDVVVKFRKVVCLPPSGITLNILPWIVWSLWKARNSLIFEGRLESTGETVLRGIKLAREWSISQAQGTEKNNLPKDLLNRSREQTSLPIAEGNRVVCTTDAAWNKDSLTAGLAWIFTGAGIRTPINGSVVERPIGSPLIAEASAIRSALCMAISLEFTSLDVFSDNQTLIRAISGITQAKEVIGIVKDICSISTEFASISFSFFSRTLNAKADALAKETLRFSSTL